MLDEYSRLGLVRLWFRHISEGLRRRLRCAVLVVLVVEVAVALGWIGVVGGFEAVVSGAAGLGTAQFEVA